MPGTLARKVAKERRQPLFIEIPACFPRPFHKFIQDTSQTFTHLVKRAWKGGRGAFFYGGLKKRGENNKSTWKRGEHDLKNIGD